jgi:hypothetical protein
MGASDYMVDPQERGFGPPNMAAQLFGMISSLPEAYQKGVEQKFARGQMRREEELQKPILGPDGKPTTDIPSISSELLKRGGGPYAKDLLPFLFKQQFLNEDQGPGQSAYGGASPARPRTDMQRPEELRQPPPPELGPEPSPGTVNPQSIGGQPQNLTGPTIMPSGGAAPPQAGPPTPNQRVAQGQPPHGAPQQPPSGAAGMVPPGADPRAYAQALKQAAEGERTRARREAIAGIPSKAREDKAAAYDKTADDILKEIGEAGRPTGAQKEARDPTVQGVKGIELAQKQELTRGDALQKGLQGAAREFETSLKPHLDAMRGILNDPNFVSGAGVGFQEALNKIRSSPLFAGLPGYDPNAALPNEAIRKVVAASILNQTTELKAEAAEMGGSAGRLFQQQISLMEKAAQNPENTAPALRYLTELQQRMGDHARGIADLASKYEGKYGRGVLDNNFNEVLSKYNNAHPIFTPAEMRDMRLFAPPTAPAIHDKREALAWAEKAGIRPGDPIKTPGGRIVAFDPSKFQ